MKRTITIATLLTALCIGLSLLTLSLTGCSTVARALNIQNPRYSLRDVRPHVNIGLPLSASTIDFDFNLGVDNPNGVGIRLDGLDFGLFINDNHILDSSTQQRISIPSRGSTEIPLRARVGYNEIRSLFREVTDAIQGNRARYEVRGNAHYDTPAGRLTFPVTIYANR